MSELALARDVVVLSPHADDAVLSLGAALRHLTRSGATVRVVTVLAGDAASDQPSGDWDRAAGFGTAGEAARARREEDRRACAIIGAEPRWLPFFDDQYDRGGSDETIWHAVRTEVASADIVLAPGFPLDHPDHRWLNRLVLAHRTALPRLGLYAEQPYTLRAAHRPGQRPNSSLPDRLAKLRACSAYRSQLRLIGRPMLRLAFQDTVRGAEAVAWLDN